MIFNDVMVDIETTGTDYGRNAIIQISAVKFDYAGGQVSDDVFDRCLNVHPGREWDMDTRHWWLRQGNVLQEIQSRGEDPHAVMYHFQQWLLKDWPQTTEGLRFWSKPTSFDHPFLASYFRMFGIDFPCLYRYARDLNSFMAGLTGNPEHPKFEIDFKGEAHNALFDVVHQIKLLLHAKQNSVQGQVLA